MTAADTLRQAAVHAIHALKSPPPDGSQHYQAGWDAGLEAAIDAVRDAFEQAPALAVARQLLGTGEQAEGAPIDPFGYEERERTGRNGGLTVQADTETAPARVGRCPVMFEGGGRCEKDADHRAGRWPDDPHTPTPAATEEAAR